MLAKISSPSVFFIWTDGKIFCFTTFAGLKNWDGYFDQNFFRIREPFSKHSVYSMKLLYVLSCLILASVVDLSVAGATSGRAAYLEGRETGDLSKAYKWAWDSKELGDRWGRQLLKMIYINTNLHHDPVEAHRWLTRALNEGNKRLDYVIIWKNRLETTMTKEQIQEADSQALD